MITSRNYEQGDYEKIINFLRDLYKLNNNRYWIMPQFWDDNENYDPKETEIWHGRIRIWEDAGKIVAVGSTAYDFGEYLDVHPDYYELTSEMIDWAESLDWGENELVTGPNGENMVYIWSTEANKYRNEILEARGYKKPPVPIFVNEQSLEGEIEKPQLPEDYTVHSMSEDIELIKRYELGYKIFNSVESYEPNIPEYFYARLKAPMYRKDLDIVTKYKDGTLASCCILWFDEETKTGVLEPVGTHPDHRKKGLGKVVILEALNRLKALGGKAAYVICHGEDRMAFYSSTGFKCYDKGGFWRRAL